MLTFFKHFSSFLKTGVVSAFFRLLGNTFLDRELLKLWHNIYKKISLFSFNILIGISYCCEALLQMRFVLV